VIKLDDVTNYMNNLGKELEAQTFDLRVTWEELNYLKDLAQNVDIPEKHEIAARCFEAFKEITGYAQRRYLVNKDVGH
jgi:hypothetical protein